jgi:hypothetical protein
MISRSLVIAMLCAFLGLSGPLAAQEPDSTGMPPGLPEILRDALLKDGAESGHWAYTETNQAEASVGKPQGETIVRFDPSKPYAEQYTALKINGQEPTEKQRDGYRRRGERRGRKLEPAVSQNGASTAPPVNVGGQKFSLDFTRAAVVTEDATSVTYQLPMKNNGKEEFPVEKFQFLIRVNREHRVLEQVSMKLKEAFRVKVIAKFNAMEFRMDYTTVDSQFPPQLTSVTGAFAAKMLLMNVNFKTVAMRTDFQRVKPFNERPGVKAPPVTLLEFMQ